jgi:hypothetical protein
MSRSFVLSLQRPQESLGVALPMARRVSQARSKAYVGVCALFSMLFLSFSIISVNTSAAKTFDMRTLERQAERLAEEVNHLEAQAAVLQSYASLQDRVRNRGYIPVQQAAYLP